MGALSHVGWAEPPKASLTQGSATEKLHLPSAQLTGHGSALERRCHNTQEHQEQPLCPAQGDTTYLWQGEEGQPRVHGARAKSLSQPHLESQAAILVPPRSHSHQVQKLQSRHCPAWPTLCNLRVDGRCLKGSLLKKRQIKSNRNHRTNWKEGGKKK